jgi:sodium/potassium-transporting ATPase subunit alpha
MLPDNCMILRDGAQVTVLASDIAPGDILYIKAGNKLPADVRFVEISSDAKFDRSILTGKIHSGRKLQQLTCAYRRICASSRHG